ncbi:MAG: CBS domain-containing protein [Bradymonadia bacterium]
MRISQYMTDKVITARATDGLRSTFFTMRRSEIRHMPVVDVDGSLIGLISDRDLRRPNWVDEAPDVTHIYNLDDDMRVGDVMTERVQVVHTYDSIHKAIKLFLEHKYGALPVLNKENQLVGILSALDLLRAFDELMADYREMKKRH